MDAHYQNRYLSGQLLPNLTQLNPCARSSFGPRFSRSYQKHMKHKEIEISKELVRILRHGKYLGTKMDYGRLFNAIVLTVN